MMTVFTVTLSDFNNIDQLTGQNVHVAVLDRIAGLLGLFHRVSWENSWDALQANINCVIYRQDPAPIHTLSSLY